jgi:uncharacterized protein YyaL (SSP411 family)
MPSVWRTCSCQTPRADTRPTRLTTVRDIEDLVPNRLAASTSPYLLQHQENPVDWFEWGAEAFERARSRDVPVLLSVGYAACHWCHVMAHESFEDEDTAALMNELFVSVKVDREERPDVDAVYMDAVTAMTGHGGWPMTVFLTPDAKPFFAGTYFPPQSGHGMPAFREVLRAVSETWRTRRDDVDRQGTAVVDRLEQMKDPAPFATAAPPSEAELAEALDVLRRQYDYARGGFGDAPKFPPSMVLEFLLREHGRTGDHDALLMAEGTMRAMAAGGVYDQLAGGFARYSVDAGWVVPHFEKMLYDNAQLARVYLHLWRSTGRPLGRRVAEETADFMVGELLTPEGGLASALDADSEGEEGVFYVWTPDELVDVLGDDDGRWAASLLSVLAAGTFERGASTLQLRRAPDDEARWAAVRERLLLARAARVRPARDDKVVAAWNGLAVAALAETGALLDRPDLVEAAREVAQLLVSLHVVDGRLRRVSRDGVVGAPAGVLEDYGDVAEGLLTLFSVTGDESWLSASTTLLDVVLDQFVDGEGGFFDTAHDAEPLVRRPRDVGDNAAPSGHAAVTGALLTAAALTGDRRYRDAAAAALARVGRFAVSNPRFAGWSLAVAEAWLDGPREVAVVAAPGGSRDALRRVALLARAPGAAVAVGEADSSIPLLHGRHAPTEAGDGASAWLHVCRGFVCELPTADVHRGAELVNALPELAVPSPPTMTGAATTLGGRSDD